MPRKDLISQVNPVRHVVQTRHGPMSVGGGSRIPCAPTKGIDPGILGNQSKAACFLALVDYMQIASRERHCAQRRSCPIRNPHERHGVELPLRVASPGMAIRAQGRPALLPWKFLLRVGIHSLRKPRLSMFIPASSKRASQCSAYAPLGAACERAIQTTSIICVYNRYLRTSPVALCLSCRNGAGTL